MNQIPLPIGIPQCKHLTNFRLHWQSLFCFIRSAAHPNPSRGPHQDIISRCIPRFSSKPSGCVLLHLAYPSHVCRPLLTCALWLTPRLMRTSSNVNYGTRLDSPHLLTCQWQPPSQHLLHIWPPYAWFDSLRVHTTAWLCCHMLVSIDDVISPLFIRWPLVDWTRTGLSSIWLQATLTFMPWCIHAVLHMVGLHLRLKFQAPAYCSSLGALDDRYGLLCTWKVI